MLYTVYCGVLCILVRMTKFTPMSGVFRGYGMKQPFEMPVLEILCFTDRDIVCASSGFDTPGESLGGGGSVDLPIDPF